MNSSPAAPKTPAPTSPLPDSPQILAFLPAIALAGGQGFSMLILGVNVAANAVVNFGSTQLIPTSLLPCSPGEFCPEIVSVPASAVASAGQIPLSLTNPGAGGGTSAAVLFLVLANTAFPIQESVDNSVPPVPANGNSTHSSIAAGAAFVVFDSTATNLAPGTTSGHSQVYLRNSCFARQPNCVPQTTLISAGSNRSPGAGGMQGSDKPVISLDGRFVAFESDDTNLVPGVTQPVEQIYLRDTCNSALGPVEGCAPSTTLISASSVGGPGNAPSLNPTISSFGFFVAFQSTATNLGVAAPSGSSQIYLSRQCPTIPLLGEIAGCTPSLALASMDASGSAGDNNSANPSLDPIGLVLSFASLADNITNTPGNGFQQIYARNTCSLLAFPDLTLACPNVTVAISADANGNLGISDSISPSTDFGGIDIAYATRAPNILPPNTFNQQIVGTTTCILEQTVLRNCGAPNTVIVSVDQSGVPGQADSSSPTIAAGRIAFTSQAGLLPNVSGQQVYAVGPCLLSGGTCTLTLVSAGANGGGPVGGDFASMEASGAFTAFAVTASGATPSEVFLADPFF